MISKFLEGTRNYMLSGEQPICIEYYMLETEKNGVLTYGVEIVKKTSFMDKDILIESDIVEKLSDCKETVSNILNKLIGNGVTPVNLIHILDDLLESEALYQ